MRKTPMIVLALSAVAVFPLAACGDNSTATPASAQPSATTYLDPAAVGPMGSTFKVFDEKNQLAEFTVTNPHDVSGRYALDLTVAARQGNSIAPGVYRVLTDQGQKIDEYHAYYSAPGQIDLTGGLTAGETRTGYASFEVPAGAKVTQVLMSQNDTIKTKWNN